MKKNHLAFIALNADEIAITAINLHLLHDHIGSFKSVTVFIAQSARSSYLGEWQEAMLKNQFSNLGANVNFIFSGTGLPRKVKARIYSQLAKRFANSPVWVVSGCTILHQPEFLKIERPINAVISAPDDMWPERYLYGLKLNELWANLFEQSNMSSSMLINNDYPETYWRHYPLYSLQCFFIKNITIFAENYKAHNDNLIENLPAFLHLQDVDQEFPSFWNALTQEAYDVLNIDWDDHLQFGDSALNCVLRLPEGNLENKFRASLENPSVKKIINKSPLYTALFLRERFWKIRSGFDDIQKQFSPKRMDKLILRRRLRKSLRDLANKIAKNRESKPSSD